MNVTVENMKFYREFKSKLEAKLSTILYDGLTEEVWEDLIPMGVAIISKDGVITHDSGVKLRIKVELMND